MPGAPARLTQADLRARLVPGPVPDCAPLRLYTAHARSGLSQLGLDIPPYWARPWPGGLALARHVLETPDLVKGRRVWDLGAGSGLVGLAAAQAGAATVTAFDVDPNARTATALNAALNRTTLRISGEDLLEAPVPPEADVILAGDLFYNEDLAKTALRYLVMAHQSGATVLLGDIGRPTLPLTGLVRCAVFPVRDVGDTQKTPPRQGGVYCFADHPRP